MCQPSARPGNSNMSDRESTREYEARSRYQDPETAREYDRARFRGDSKRERKDAATKRAVVEALRRLEDIETVLDVPCGTGRMTRLLIEEGFSYTGTDVSGEMMHVARSKLEQPGNVRLVQADAAALPFPDGAFDCVVTVRFLNLIPSEARVRILEEFHRVSNGHMVAVATHLGPDSSLRRRFRALIPWLEAEPEGEESPRWAMYRDIRRAGWEEHFEVPYKYALLSRARAVCVFRKASAE